MNIEGIRPGQGMHWWHRLVGANVPSNVAPLSEALAGHQPIVIALEHETPTIKARILSRLLSRRLEACRHEINSDSLDLAARIVPMPGLPKPDNTMKPQPDTLPVVEQEPLPAYSPKPKSADAPFWLDDTDPSPSPSPSPNPGP
jgi:hypothetical protein